MVLVGTRRLRRRGTLVQATSGELRPMQHGRRANVRPLVGKLRVGETRARAPVGGKKPRRSGRGFIREGLPGGVAFGGQFTTYCHWFSRAARAALSAPIAQ